jgi:alpha-tubulin suppressor-like RCC1 family protein
MKLSSARFDMETSRLEKSNVKNYAETVVGGSAGVSTTSNYTVDLSAGNVHHLILAVATTTFTFSNPPAWGTSATLTLILKQDATGGRLVGWPAEVQWAPASAPTLTATSSGIDVIAFTTFDSGSTWHGAVSLADSKRLRTLWSFGDNTVGQLGDGTIVFKSSPVQIGSLTNWAMAGGGVSHSLALKTDGTLWSFGDNTVGQLGDQTTITKSSPVQIGSLTNWAMAGGGVSHSLALKTDGTLWSFGDNTVGQLGDQTTITKSSPVQIGSLTNWAMAGGGVSHSLALKTDGTLWSFGSGFYSSLGDGTTISKSSPVQIGSLTTWANIAFGWQQSLALKTDGTLWSFGRNVYGQLGDGTASSKSSPVQIGTLTNWADVIGGYRHMLALKTDGTLWSFGRNNFGQLGDDTTINKSSPVQIGSLTNWASGIGGVGNTTLALKTDGTLWNFGRSNYGQLGDGTTIDKSSPVQISSLTTWASIGGGGSHFLVLRKE